MPFVVAAALLGPFAYYPTHYITSPDPHFRGFWQQWLALGVWPAGPVWFLWVSLVFDGIAAAAFTIAPGAGVALGHFSGRLARHPIAYVGAVMVLSALAYLPLVAMFSPGHWLRAGPFWVQISRSLHYAIYFLAGVGLGVHGTRRGLLASDGELARQWPLWIVAALTAFAVAASVLLATLSAAGHGGPGLVLLFVGAVAFVWSCACSSFAYLATFLRFARRQHRAWDSVRANAYGIFVFHFVCVSWLQLWLLDAPLPGAVKVLLVFAGVLALSWSVAAALRRVPAIAAVL